MERPLTPATFGRRDLALFAVALLFLAAALARQIAVSAPFGHDEAVYAGGGRELIGGPPASGYTLYRPVGMRAVAALGLLAGSNWPEWAPRAVVLLASLGFLIAYRAFGARALGRWPAAWASAAMVTSFAFQRRGAEILSDVPALLFLVMAVHVIVAELERPERPGAALLAAAPLAAAAFYLRYGLATTLVGIALAACAVWWRPVASGRRIAIAAAALFLLLWLPHIAFSIGETGSALGILEMSGDAAHRAFLGQGLVQFPLALLLEGGPAVTLLVVIGAVHGARRLRRPPADRRERAARFLWLASVFHILATGLLVHAEFRYFFFGVAGLTLVGAGAAVEAARDARRLARFAGVAVAAVALATHCFNMHRYGRLARIRQVQAAAGALVRKAAAGESCIVLAGDVPVIGWYSGCRAHPVHRRPGGGRRFLVLFAREPGSAAVREKLARSHRLTPVGQAADAADFHGDASIYQIR